MHCRNCGQKVQDDVVFCPYCSARVNSQNLQYAQQAPQNQMGYPQQQAIPAKRKKRSGCLTALLVFLGLAAIAAAAVYFFVPGLLRPNDLGIKTSNEAYESAVQKLNLSKDDAPVSGQAEDYNYIYGEPQVVDTSLRSEELTSFFNINRPAYYALKNVQIRINPDNTIEAAATIDVDYVFKEMLNGVYSREDAKKAMPMLGLLPDEVNIYCNFTGSVRDNKLNSINISKASVMGIPIPGSIINSSDTDAFIDDNIGGYLERVTAKSNTRYDLIEVDNGQLTLKGQIPSSISRIPVR